MVILVLAGLARAEDPAPAPAPEPTAEPEPAPAPAPEPPSEEVVVYGELRVQQAHDRVVQQLEDLGFTDEVTRLPDRTIYRSAVPWAGEVVLFDDGWMDVKRQPLRVEGRRMPWARLDSPGAWVGCFVWPWLCVRTSGATIGKLKWRSQKNGTVDTLHGSVEQWGDRIADLATGRTVADLAPRLEALWNEGVPLTSSPLASSSYLVERQLPSTGPASGPLLATPAERRAALLAFYGSRTDTSWGDQVREAVGAFCRAVVQTSEDPFTDEELAAFRAAHPELPSPLAPPRDDDDP